MGGVDLGYVSVREREKKEDIRGKGRMRDYPRWGRSTTVCAHLVLGLVQQFLQVLERRVDCRCGGVCYFMGC
jgi:hypothetical protein